MRSIIGNWRNSIRENKFFYNTIDKQLYRSYNTLKNCVIGLVQLLCFYSSTKKRGDHVISFEQFIMEDGVPIYMQILLFVKRGIVAGKIRHDDELPSRRMLSAFLGVTPNTVQKAYKIEFVRRDLLESDARNVIRAMKQMGVTQDQAVSLIKRFWNEVES